MSFKVGDLVVSQRDQYYGENYGIVIDVKGNKVYCCWGKTIKEAEELNKKFKELGLIHYELTISNWRKYSDLEYGYIKTDRLKLVGPKIIKPYGIVRFMESTTKHV